MGPGPAISRQKNTRTVWKSVCFLLFGRAVRGPAKWGWKRASPATAGRRRIQGSGRGTIGRGFTLFRGCGNSAPSVPGNQRKLRALQGLWQLSSIRGRPSVGVRARVTTWLAISIRTYQRVHRMLPCSSIWRRSPVLSDALEGRC